ncbi:MAG: transcriptional regulator, lysr family, partial [Enterovirga sp.]|nr:transcriptional regulator, lysr family [Enterovirga sp.]
MAWFLPSLSALRTFEAAARHLSFTRAAAELNITQSAVSRQIRGLEDYLRLKLFERTPQQLILTPVGRAYLEEIRAALDRIQAATLTMLSDQGR